MKRVILFLTVSIFLGSSLFLGAQDKRTMQTKVADILTQMPTHDLNHRDRLMKEMIGMGAAGLEQFAAMIVPPGTGDDTRARFALGSLAHYVAQSALEPDRLMVAQVFGQAIERATDPWVKSFFFYHLNFFGKAETVPIAEKYLTDDQLVHPAVAFLQSYQSHAALHAMLGALPNLTEENLLPVVQAISTYQEPCILQPLTGLADHANPKIRKAVYSGLAGVGDPESEKILSGAAKAVDYRYDVSSAAASLLKYAENLGENGHLKLSTKICKTLIKKCTDPGQQTYALAAIGILTDQQGYAVMDYLLNGMNHPEKHYRGGILRHAAKITDIAATREWMGFYAQAEPEVKMELMHFFGNRNDLAVMSLVKDGLRAEDPALRKESMIAWSKLTGKMAIPGLLEVMAAGNPADVAAAQQVLLRLVGPDEIHWVAESYPHQNREGKIAVLEILAMRAASDYFDLVHVALGHADPDIRTAAYQALASVSGGQHVEKLLTHLYVADNDTFLEEIQDAVIASALKTGENPAEPVLKAYHAATQNQHRFLGIFAQLGGDQALQTVLNVFENGPQDLRAIAADALVNWKDYTASSALYTICETTQGDYQKKAFEGYVRQMESAPVTADQKLLLLRKIFTQATDNQQKLSVIQALRGNQTFLTLMFLGDLMADPALANAAARAAVTVALPPSGSKEGMYGTAVRKVLHRAMEVISGEESTYIRANIQTWLDEMPGDDGFVSMFNGKNLDGWQGLVKNPVARSQMSEKELAREQQIADARLPDMWTVSNQEIQFTGTGYENLCSVKEYADFEMIVDWKITKNGDSGIYLRGTPQVQIWDTSRIDVGAQVGSGGLYNNQKNPSSPLLVADNPVNDWNTFRIKMIGDRVTVYLNGKLVVDNVILENYWDRSQSIFPTGPIELQAHGTDLAFRDIYVREIKSGAYNLTVEEKTEGFTSLFNGKNLDGWIGNKTDYVVEEGIVVIRPKQGGHGNLYTEKEYGDFNFRFEFQLTPGANNGLGIRTPPEGDAAYVGMELQILDNSAPIYAQLEPYQYHGSVYGVIPAKRGFLKPVGEWNAQEVIVQGTRVKIVLNGETIVDGDIAEARDHGTMDHRDHPGLKNTKGHIGFLGHGSVVKFRNIRIKEL